MNIAFVWLSKETKALNIVNKKMFQHTEQLKSFHQNQQTAVVWAAVLGK